MKIIFLDFDGVITTLRTQWELDDEKMALVRRICDETGAKIVISSTWRWGSLETTLKKIFGKDYDDSHYLLNTGTVIDITTRDRSFIKDWIVRGHQIQKWLDEHPEVENYIILDDDSDMLPEQKSHFIHTDTYLGISEEDTEKAIRMLNVQNP